MNEGIPGYTWGKCLKYPNQEDRLKHCLILSHTEHELSKCKVNKIY